MIRHYGIYFTTFLNFYTPIYPPLCPFSLSAFPMLILRLCSLLYIIHLFFDMYPFIAGRLQVVYDHQPPVRATALKEHDTLQDQTGRHLLSRLGPYRDNLGLEGRGTD